MSNKHRLYVQSLTGGDSSRNRRTSSCNIADYHSEYDDEQFGEVVIPLKRKPAYTDILLNVSWNASKLLWGQCEAVTPSLSLSLSLSLSISTVKFICLWTFATCGIQNVKHFIIYFEIKLYMIWKYQT